jgi:9-cis-epoxycarotenoid dioxygenase
MMHDCAITARHTVILDFPLPMSTLALDTTKPSRFGVMPRHARTGDEVVWIEAPPFYAFHVANSWYWCWCLFIDR